MTRQWMTMIWMMSLLATSRPALATDADARWLRFLPTEPPPVKVVAPPVVASPTSASANSAVSDGRVDLNHADVEALDDGLAGVGRTRAEAIVAWRNKHGPFRRVEQLDEVPGIGPKLVERNRDRIILKK